MPREGRGSRGLGLLSLRVSLSSSFPLTLKNAILFVMSYLCFCHHPQCPGQKRSKKSQHRHRRCPLDSEPCLHAVKPQTPPPLPPQLNHGLYPAVPCLWPLALWRPYVISMQAVALETRGYSLPTQGLRSAEKQCVPPSFSLAL